MTPRNGIETAKPPRREAGSGRKAESPVGHQADAPKTITHRRPNPMTGEHLARWAAKILSRLSQSHRRQSAREHKLQVRREVDRMRVQMNLPPIAWPR